MSTYKDELRLNYHKSIKAFVRVYPHISDKMTMLIDNYCRTCAMYLWNSFSVDSVKCTECLNEIYTNENQKKSYSVSQVEAALAKLSERNYSMPVPRFFKDIISWDVKEGTNYSRKLASCFSIVFISFALIDSNIEYEEASLITKLHRGLVEACDASNIKPYSDDIDPFSFVSENYSFEPSVTAPKKQNINTTSINPKMQKVWNQSTIKKDSPFDQLNKLIGLTAVKLEVNEISDFTKVQKARREKGLPTSNVSYHLVFTGNPGTGKTTVARLVAKIYKELGILSSGHLVEVSAKDLIAGYVGQTAIKTNQVIEKAMGGVLFIDEAYALLDKNGQGYGQEAIDTLLKEMEDKRQDFAVIVAGYDDLMQQFINSNPGLKSRFNKFIHFDDYSADEMFEIFQSLCSVNAYQTTPEADEIIKKYFSQIYNSHGDDFANARTVRNYFETVISKQASRIAKVKDKTENILSTITDEDVSWCIEESAEETMESILNDFNSLVGLNLVKEEISDLIYVVQHQQRRKAQGLKVPSLSLHLVFMGNPGTGKTTVARYVAKIYKSLGLLSKGHLVETDRSGLVAGYVGQTAIKTQEVINSALGGVLFIDEAYTLSNGGANDYGQEAIDTLLKSMEDKREDLVVIVAGYDDLMDDFIHSNPGLESRFNRYIHFEDYSPDEMFEIFNGLCIKNQYSLSDEAITSVKSYLSSVLSSNIGNGRGVRNLFEKVVTQQAKRSSSSKSEEQQDLSMITEEDIQISIMKG